MLNTAGKPGEHQREVQGENRFVRGGYPTNFTNAQISVRLKGELEAKGAQLLLLSALGFIALGVLPLDPDDLHNEASSLHATAWLLWWVAFVPGAALFAFGMRGRSRWRPVVTASIVAAAVVLFSALIAVALMPAGIAQRLGYAAWLGWLCVASRAGR